MELCDLPKDIIKMIIAFCPYGQWFQLSKELSTLASQVISPLNCRTEENGALFWALANKKILAAISLLKDPRIDPNLDRVLNDIALLRVNLYDHKEIVELLLKDNRVDPSALDNKAIRYASVNGRKEVVEMLLKDDRVDPSAGRNYAIRGASENGHTEIVRMLLKDKRVDLCSP
jgi:ankyrin repeat protein